MNDIRDPEVGCSLARVAAVPPPAVAAPAAASGPRVRVLRPHARGGMGEVFLAHDDEVDRDVALKAIQPRFADDVTSRARFLLEAQVTGGLEHPGVVPVYGLGHYADGRPFYTMRFVKGDSLQEAVARFHEADKPNRDPGERTLALRGLLGRFADVCNAVAYAHDRGVLHRDLKPGNILLGPYGETLVVDWGLAKAGGRGAASSAEAPLQPTTVDERAVTHAGDVLGTPQYMSPEQAAGRREDLGAASDVYSLGATLYHLLTGQAPIGKGSINEVLEKVREGRFTRPRQVKPAVPPALEAVCLKAMALRPEDRYAGALELAEEVERWLADQPMRAYREGLRQRWARWRRRNKTAVAAGAALLVAGVAALAIATLWVGNAYWSEADQRARALTEQHNAEAAEARERTARDQAEGARRAALRTAVRSYGSSADACLAEARVLWNATWRPDRKQKALDLLQSGVGFERKARQALQDLGESNDRTERDVQAAWQGRRQDLRDEAVRWLTAIGLGRTRTIPLPPPPAGNADAAADAFHAAEKQLAPNAGFSPDWEGWAGLIVVSPDGSQIALAYAGDTDLLLVPCDGGAVRRLPLPAEAAPFRLGLDSESLRFVADRRVEWDAVGRVVSWSLPEGRAVAAPRPAQEQEEAKRRVTAREQKRQAESAIRLMRRGVVEAARNDRFSASLEYVGNESPYYRKEFDLPLWRERVSVRPAGGGEPRTVLRAAREDYNRALFGRDPGLLYALGEEDLVLIDLDQGLYTTAPLFEPGEQGKCLDLVPCGEGVATLEMVLDHANAPRLTCWNAVAPNVWRPSVSHEMPGMRLDVADDGLTATGGADHVVALWKDGRPLWTEGRRPSGASVPDPAYAWQRFTSGGKDLFAIERKDLLDGAGARPRTEWYNPADGKLVRSLPSDGPGRLFAASPDRRFVVVTADEKGDEAALDVWSPEEGKNLGRLGTYVLRRKADLLYQDRQEATPAVTAFFSPSGRWLLLCRHAESDVEIWKLPEVQRLAVVPVRAPWLRVEFDPQERRALLIGPTIAYPETGTLYAGSATSWPADAQTFVKAVDLATGAVSSDFPELDPKWGVETAAVRFVEDQAVVVSHLNSRHEWFPVVVLDLAAGKKTELSPRWKEADALQRWNGQQVLLSHDGKRLLLIGFEHYENNSHPQWIIQLWDLARQRLLRQELHQGFDPTDARVSADRERIHVAFRVSNDTKDKLYLCWNWDDGADGTPRSETLWAADPSNRSALWRGDEGMIYYDDASGAYTPLENSAGAYKRFRAALSPDGGVLALEQRPYGGFSQTQDHRSLLVVGGGALGALFVSQLEIEKDIPWRDPGPNSGLWDVRTGSRLRVFSRGQSFRAFDPTGRWAGTVDPRTGEVRVWDVQAHEVAQSLNIPTLRGNEPNVYVSTRLTPGDLPGRSVDLHPVDLRLSADGKRAAVLSQGVVQLWDLEAAQPLQTVPMPGHSGAILALAQHAGAGLVATTGPEGVVLLWDRKDGRLRAPLVGHTGQVVPALAFSPDGAVLASGGSDGTVRVWRPDGECAWTYQDDRPGAGFSSLAFHPRTGVLAAGTGDGRILFLDVKERKFLGTQSTDGSAVTALAFSHDGERMASGGASGQLRLWRGGGREALATMDSGSPVAALVFAPGDDLLATGGEAVQFWSAADGRRLWRVEDAVGPVSGLAFNGREELLIADRQRAGARALDLAELNRRLRGLGFELPGEP